MNESYVRISLSNFQPIIRSMSLRRLFEHLTAQIHQKNSKNTLHLLAQGSIRLYKLLTEANQSLYDADLRLIEFYCVGQDRERILQMKRLNSKFVLFTQQTFRFLYYLLIHDIDYSISSGFDSQSKFLPEYEIFSLSGVFQIANEILSRLEVNFIPSPEESIEIRNYYSRRLFDPAGAIGRSGLFYENPYYNCELEKRFQLSVTDLRRMTFEHFTHVMTKDPAVIALRSCFKLPPEKQRVPNTVFGLISAKYKSKPIRYTDLVSTLLLNLSIGKEVIGKPFLELDSLCYCVCPELLGSVLADLPHHAIFTDKLSKNEGTNSLHDQRGQAYQIYVQDLTRKVCGEKICRIITSKKRGEFGDLIIDIAADEKLILELKVADPQESVKKGNIEETIKRFLLPRKRKKNGKEHPGPLQVMERAIEYREEYKFTGKIYTAVVYYGRFPEIEQFDCLYAQFIKTDPRCQMYEEDARNSPTILMNAFTWEIMLSAIVQRQSSDAPQNMMHSMLEALSPYAEFPSRSSEIIEKYIHSSMLKYSVAPLFKEQIHNLAEECKSLMLSE